MIDPNGLKRQMLSTINTLNFQFSYFLIASKRKLTDTALAKIQINNKNKFTATFDIGSHIIRDSYNIDDMIRENDREEAIEIFEDYFINHADDILGYCAFNDSRWIQKGRRRRTLISFLFIITFYNIQKDIHLMNVFLFVSVLYKLLIHYQLSN